jgi:signal transduction histidine kinase
MGRIRITLFVLALAVGTPVALLAWRALDGLAVQRAVRHQAVAERAFDEMERALSGFLEREEERPVGHYAFYLEDGRRSPLATPGLEDFVVGAFQIDPDGSVHTPLEPRDAVDAAERGDWPPSPEISDTIERVTAVVNAAWRPGGEFVDADRAAGAGDVAGAADLRRQAPGTTRPVTGAAEAKREARADRDAAAAGRQSAYEVLQSFNRGVEEREERRKKLADTLLPQRVEAERARGVEAKRAGEAGDAEGESTRYAEAGLEPFEAPTPRPSSTPRAARHAPSLAAPDAPAEALEKVRPRAATSDDADAAGTREAARDELEAPPPAAEPLPETVAPVEPRAQEADAFAVVEPMLGRAADARHLLLYRTVLLGSRGYRQGLVLDRERLGTWLTERVIAPSALAGAARVRFGASGSDLPVGGGTYGFEHRFAEPFDALSARLELAALPGVGSPGAIYGLVAAVIGVGLLGLLALHRSVSATVDFAERRSNFVAAVTHELKTPLTAIRMYAEMLRDGLVGAEEKRAEYYGTITDESERLTRLIDNVLEFSRLERGQREMSFSVGSPAPVLEEAAEKLRSHVESEGFRIELAIEPELPAVRFDRDALLQVIYNLVDNAMKYGRSAHARKVVLEARRRDDAVQVSVRDFGPGVPGRQVKRIFEPFYRGGDELTRSAKGTGIGLALVKELAERMGAAVSGANATDGGFRVQLAFREADGVV